MPGDVAVNTKVVINKGRDNIKVVILLKPLNVILVLLVNISLYSPTKIVKFVTSSKIIAFLNEPF